MSYEESKLFSLLKKQDIDSLFQEATNYLCQTKSLFEEKEQLQQENERLKMINKEYERLNKEKYRGFKIIDVQEYDRYELLSYKNYKDNWNKLKEHLKEKIVEERSAEHLWLMGCYDEDKLILDKMQELEQGSDSDEFKRL